MPARRSGGASGTRPALAALLAASALACGPGRGDADLPWKVQVMLGFHGNFYHSWRGDTPDEAGFGTDIRIVREILRMLDEANAQGLDARGYWDVENLFTYETILPEHAPDIIEGIRRRVRSGRDEAISMSYDNGLLHAMTEDELRASVRWSFTNPWGSGIADLFGTVTPLLRPQEMTLTTGSLPLLAEEGVEGLVLYYSGFPFNSISNFVPPLPPEQRFGATWLRLRDGGPRMVLLPAVSIGDVLNNVSIEHWLRDLRALQTSGRVKRDLLLHMNFDADAESWLPVDLPPGLGWIPNSGGLPEYIAAVNRYDWAEFTTPGRYLAEHEPVGEVLVRQDLADGAFDGQYSWAEKLPSHAIWTTLEGARLAARRADALAADAPPTVAERVQRLLRQGRDSSFFERVRSLSTTHFGMSTPLLNEERQAKAEAAVGRALAQARRAERLAADHAAARAVAPPPEALYAFLVRDTRGARPGGRVRSLLRIPLVLPAPPPPLRLVDAAGAETPHALLNVEDLGDGRAAAELWTLLALRPAETRQLALLPAAGAPAPPEAYAAGEVDRLTNEHLELTLDASDGIASFAARGATGTRWEIGGDDFLAPFITYRRDERPVEYGIGAWEITRPPGERPGALARARLRSAIRFSAAGEEVAARLDVALTLPPDVPWLVADVEVAYPATEKRDLLHNMIQKLRRPADLGWIEVAPFPLHPRLSGTRDAPLRVWKHNYLGVTSHYDLDYAAVNPANAEIDAFNHQVTAGWVAVSDRERGLLVGEAGDVRSSFAFAPMRLRERDGRQVLWLNPFGSYFGRQLDYSHVPGNGLGVDFTVALSAALRPNGPSYNGGRERFSLLLAPYTGDAPPAALQAEAGAFFAPPALVYLRVPDALGAPALVAQDVRDAVAAAQRRLARRAGGALPTPRAFLVNETRGAADLVWDEPDDARIDAYEIAWRRAGVGEGWQTRRVGPARRHRVQPLEDGGTYAFRLRAVGTGEPSPWTETREVAIGPVPVVDVASNLRDLPISLILRMFWHSLEHVATTW